jgi:hypothetical protein
VRLGEQKDEAEETGGLTGQPGASAAVSRLVPVMASPRDAGKALAA